MRYTAYRLPIREVNRAERVEEEGRTLYRVPSGYKVKRVSVWGVVVRKFVGENHTMFLLDDFTDVIPIYVFEGEVDVNEGDVVRVIGTVREREGEKRIFAETVRRISTEEELIHRLENLLTVLRGEREEEVKVVDLL